MAEQVTFKFTGGVVPDKDSSLITASELIDALNVRVGRTNPKGGSSIYKIAGKFLLTNPLLPSGQNKGLAWCADKAKRNLYWINWNDTPSNQTIFQYNETTGFRIVLQQDMGFTQNSKPTIAYVSNFLAWTSPDIPEPRQINVEKALSGGYGVTPIPDWQLYQIQHVPAIGLEVTADTGVIAAEIPKPAANVSLTGYQFSYNLEMFSGEGRIAPATQLYWNNNIVLTIPASEVLNYIYSNPFVIAVKFYFRIGNTGNWTCFRRLKNVNLTPSQYTISVGPLRNLGAISVPTTAALLNADGVPRFAKDLIFGDNREILGGIRTGYDITMPTATTSIVNNDYDFDAREWRQFAPIRQEIDLGILALDKQGREIGAVPIDSVTLWPSGNGGWQVDISDVYTEAGGGSFDLDALPWDQMVDYLALAAGDPQLPSQWDLRQGNPKIRITPSSSIALAPEVDTLMLITKNHLGLNSFIRTQSRPYYIYKKGSEGTFTLWLSNSLGESFTASGAEYTFYGLGFQFASGEPINFSTEQNYYVQVIGSLYTTSLTVPTPNLDPETLYTSGIKEYKITDQLGNILIAKTAWGDITPSRTFSFVGSTGFSPTTGTDRYGHVIVDTILYTVPLQPVTTWNRVPQVVWTNSEWVSLIPKDYYGDAFSTGDQKTMSTPGVAVQSSWFNGTYYPNNISLPWQGYWSAMNLNGIYNEIWDSDIGAATVINADPQEVDLPNAINHGEQYFGSTLINSLFTFNPLNRTFVQQQLGSITKMVTLAVNNAFGANVYAVCQSGVEMVFLGRTQQTGTDGNSVMSLSTKVFGSQNVLRTDYGAAEKEQVMMTNVGIVWFFDEVNNALVQLSANGLDPVSVQRDFQSNCANIANGSVVGYDPLYKEAVVQSQGNGLAYNFKDDLYQGRRTYGPEVPEVFMWLSSDQASQQMYGLSDGQLYVFNQGQMMECVFTCIFNENQRVLKKAIGVQILSPIQSTFRIDLTNDTGLTTDIQQSEFEDREGQLYASVKTASNSPGGKWDGKDMHGYIYVVELSDNTPSQKELNTVRLIYSESPTNQR